MTARARPFAPSLLCLIALLLALVASPVWADPDGGHGAVTQSSGKHGPEGHDEPEDLAGQPPVQAYYHRAFFGEPWRTPERSIASLERQGAATAAATIALGLALMWRRRRWLRRNARA